MVLLQLPLLMSSKSLSGDIGRAEESFASVHKRIVNAQDSSKRKYLYLSYIGSVSQFVVSDKNCRFLNSSNVVSR